MTTETTQVTQTEETQTTEETKSSLSPTEQAAHAAGWVTKDEWIAQGKNLDEWRSAKEFQERGELFDEISRLKETTKKQNAAFKVLVEHHKKIRELAVQEALEKLRQEKKTALENHEIERVFDIDEQIEKVRTQRADTPNIEIPEDTGPSPTFAKWHKRNSWYKPDSDDEASQYAEFIGSKFRKSNPNATEVEFLEHVESKISKKFPELFENPESKKPGAVNPSSTRTDVNTNDGFKLTPEEEAVCQMLVASGDMTRKQYVDEIKKTRVK